MTCEPATKPEQGLPDIQVPRPSAVGRIPSFTFTALWCFMAVGIAVSGGVGVADAVLAAVLIVVVIVLVYCSSRPAMWASDDGLHVRGVWRTRVFPWPEIEGFPVATWSVPLVPTLQVINVRTRDGRVVELSSTQRPVWSKRSRADFDATLNALERWLAEKG